MELRCRNECGLAMPFLLGPHCFGPGGSSEGYVPFAVVWESGNALSRREMDSLN